MTNIMALTGVNSLEAKSLAHDLRSPLSALKLTTQSLGLSRESQQLIDHSLHSLEQLISRISQLGQAKCAPKVQQAKPYHITRRCLQQLGPKFKAKGVLLKADLDPRAAPHYCQIDELDFERALTNLLQNALEAIVENPCRPITVRLKLKKKTLRLFIEDSGKGIPADLLGKIASPGVTHGKQYGTGHGLYQAKMTVEQSGGRLLISSEEGKGTIITLDLPFSAPFQTGELGQLQLCS